MIPMAGITRDEYRQQRINIALNDLDRDLRDLWQATKDADLLRWILNRAVQELEFWESWRTVSAEGHGS